MSLSKCAIHFIVSSSVIYLLSFSCLVQSFGGAGLSSDLPLAVFWSWARILRLADGPDEVHLRAVAKKEVKRDKRS